MHGRLTDDKEMQTRMRNDAFGPDGVHTAALCEKRDHLLRRNEKLIAKLEKLTRLFTNNF